MQTLLETHVRAHLGELASFGRSSELFGFEGAEELWRSRRAGLTRDPLLTVSECADRHRMLSSPASAERGHYRVGPYSQLVSNSPDCFKLLLPRVDTDGFTDFPTASGRSRLNGNPTLFGCSAPHDFVFASVFAQ